MIVLLDTSEDLTVCATELGGMDVAQLLTPLTKFTLQRPGERFAIDNGAFSVFNGAAFLSLLRREEDNRKECIFVAVPDVVGSARRTLEVFARWRGDIASWPLALVCQDGQEDLPIPWSDIAAVFIGGSTGWKMSAHAAQIIRAAQALDKWTHVGRVNTPERFGYFADLGVDSCDGTGLARYSWMRERMTTPLHPRLALEQP